MRVVFVDNLLFEDSEGVRKYVLQPHLGLISLIAVLERAGHDAQLFDPKVEVYRTLRLNDRLYRDIADQVLRMRPDVVGFTSLGCNFVCTVKVAGYLKRWRPSLPILLGGPHATVLDREIIARFTEFDCIVRNEAETTILPLLDNLHARTLADLSGVTYRHGGSVEHRPGIPPIADLDALPMGAYDRYPIAELGLTTLRVEAGRGCPFECTFCSTATFFGRRYRLKSAARLVGELDHLHATYGISDFSLTHDLFTVNRHKVREFCDLVAPRGYTWKCSARMDCVDPDLLHRMYTAGCRSVYYGVEAGSDRMQKTSKKRLDLALFDPILDATQRTGMGGTVSFITGYPDESRADQAATLDMIGSCFARDRTPLTVQLHLLTPEPGTELLKEFGSRIAYDGHVSDFNFPTLEPDDGAIMSAHPDIFLNHHYYRSALPRARHIFVTTAYQYLIVLGFPLLRHVLSFYGGRLSRVVDALHEWAVRNGGPAACDRGQVERYFAAAFGDDHHVPGMVRYGLEAAELVRRAGVDSSADGAAATADTFRLSRRASVVRDVPHCPAILARLAAPDGEISPELLRDRFTLLMHLPTSQSAIQNFVLSEASAALLRYVRDAPAPLREFEQRTNLPVPPAAFLDRLVERGILVRGTLAASAQDGH